MSQNIAKDTILNVLEKRYDFQSARNVLDRAAAGAGLQGKDTYSSGDLASLIQSLRDFASHIDNVVNDLEGLSGNGKAGNATKADDKAEAKADNKASSKTAAKADDKQDAKASSKTAAKASSKKSTSKTAKSTSKTSSSKKSK